MKTLSLTKPGASEIAQFLKQQSKCDFNYPDVRATSGDLPSGYDHHRIETDVGRGPAVFHKAKSAMLAWKQFDVGGVSALPTNTPIREGETIAIRAQIFGLWALAACRIVDVVNDNVMSSKKFGFSFGTLPGHPEQGEERFEICCDANSVVTYRITAFFRPNYLTAKLAWPYFRRRFNNFRQQSADTLRQQCQIASKAEGMGDSS